MSNCCILKNTSSLLPNSISEKLDCNDGVLAFFDSSNNVTRKVIGSIRKLAIVADELGGVLCNAPSGLKFKEGDVVIKKVNDVLGLIRGDFSGLKDFNLDSFVQHVKAAAKRVGVQNKKDGVSSARRKYGKYALKKLLKPYVDKMKSKMKIFNLPFMKSPIKPDQLEEVMYIIVGNLTLFGIDVFSYFGIPMTGFAEFTSKCMLEYAYDLAMERVANIIPQFKALNGVGTFFDDIKKEVGDISKIMTDEEKGKCNATNPELNDLNDAVNKA